MNLVFFNKMKLYLTGSQTVILKTPLSIFNVALKCCKTNSPFVNHGSIALNCLRDSVYVVVRCCIIYVKALTEERKTYV